MRRFAVAFLCSLAIVALWVSRSATVDTTLIAFGSSWKYLDNGSNQQTAWRTNGFPDGSWAAGNAELGYGDGDEATVVSFGPNSGAKYITTYFRKTFNVSDPSLYQSLTLNVVYDDGVVVYLNGTEVHRGNMPGGSVAFNTLASVAWRGEHQFGRDQYSSPADEFECPGRGDSPGQRHQHGHQLRRASSWRRRIRCS